MAGQTGTKKVHKIDVVRYGDQIAVPESITLEKAIETLQKQLHYENEFVVVQERIEAAPFDGAIALMKAIERRLGFVFQKARETFFGDIPPQMISVQVGPKQGDTVNAPWGLFQLPGTAKNNTVETDVEQDDEGRFFFVASFHVQHKWEKLAKEIAESARQIVREESIYRGKALRIRFRNDRGGVIPMPQPTFLDVDNLDFSDLVYTQDLERRIAVELLTPVRMPAMARQLGVPAKRGVLLAGPYGTGKTLLAHKVAAEATANGWTYLYVQNVQELAEAIRWTQPYDPVVIFAEDLDRVVAGTERTNEIDQVLNTIDGIDSKHRELMVVLTTNHLENIHDAMLRPGRLDVILPILPPDAEAVQRLIHNYGRGLVDHEADLTEVGALMAGEIPAVIREVVERSKLAALYRTGRTDNLIVTGEDLLVAAQTVKAQRSLVGVKQPEPSVAEQFGAGFGAVMAPKILELSRMATSNLAGTEHMVVQAEKSGSKRNSVAKAS